MHAMPVFYSEALIWTGPSIALGTKSLSAIWGHFVYCQKRRYERSQARAWWFLDVVALRQGQIHRFGWFGVVS